MLQCHLCTEPCTQFVHVAFVMLPCTAGGWISHACLATQRHWHFPTLSGRFDNLFCCPQLSRHIRVHSACVKTFIRGWQTHMEFRRLRGSRHAAAELSALRNFRSLQKLLRTEPYKYIHVSSVSVKLNNLFRLKKMNSEQARPSRLLPSVSQQCKVTFFLGAGPV